MRSDEILNELLNKQLRKIPNEKKLRYSDMKRMCKYINDNIFDENKCVIWDGYITNTNKSDRGLYINFYFKGKKTALHRLLYYNFIGDLEDDEYLKFTCENKGKCCNVHHLQKFKYNIKPLYQNTTINEKKINRRRKKEKIINTYTTFTLSFE